MTTPRNDIEQELHDILDQADVLITQRRAIVHSLDTAAFRTAAVVKKQSRTWLMQRPVWYAAAAGAILVVTMMVMFDKPLTMRQVTGVPVIASAGRDQTALQSTGSLETTLDDGIDGLVDAGAYIADTQELIALLSETAEAADDVWERGERDLDRLLTDPSEN